MGSTHLLALQEVPVVGLDVPETHEAFPLSLRDRGPHSGCRSGVLVHRDLLTDVDQAAAVSSPALDALWDYVARCRKSQAGNRVIALPAPLVAELARHRTRSDDQGADEFVFTSSSGAPRAKQLPLPHPGARN